MSKTDLYSLAKDLLITNKDRAVLLDALSVIQELAYTKDANIIKSKIKESIPEKFFELFESIILTTKSPTDLTKTMSDLQMFVNNLPVIHLTIGYTPTRAQIEQLSMRIRATFNPEALLDYAINHDFALQIQVDVNGKSFTKSLENSI